MPDFGETFTKPSREQKTSNRFKMHINPLWFLTILCVQVWAESKLSSSSPACFDMSAVCLHVSMTRGLSLKASLCDRCCSNPHVLSCRPTLCSHSALPPSRPLPRGDASSAASRLVRADSHQITDVLHRGNCLPNPLQWCKFKGSPVMEIMPNWFGDFEMSTQHG